MIRSLLALLLAVIFAGTGHAEGPVMVDLTKEDLIAVYDVPVKTRPAYKLVWKSAAAATYHLSIESRKPNGPWIASYSADESPTKLAWLTILLDERPEADGRRPVLMHWGFENDGMSGWGSRDFMIDGETTAKAVTPAAANGEILRLATETTEYRVRVQKTPTP